jgi:hypothetical protein
MDKVAIKTFSRVPRGTENAYGDALRADENYFIIAGSLTNPCIQRWRQMKKLSSSIPKNVRSWLSPSSSQRSCLDEPCRIQRGTASKAIVVLAVAAWNEIVPCHM